MAENPRSYEKKQTRKTPEELAKETHQKELELHDELLCQATGGNKADIKSYIEHAFLAKDAQNDIYRHRGFESMLRDHPKELLGIVSDHLEVFQSKFPDLLMILMDTMIQSESFIMLMWLIAKFNENSKDPFFLENIRKIAHLPKYTPEMKKFFQDHILVTEYDKITPYWADEGWQMIQKMFSKDEIEGLCGGRQLTPLLRNIVETYLDDVNLEKLLIGEAPDDFLDTLLMHLSFQGDNRRWDEKTKGKGEKIQDKVAEVLTYIFRRKRRFFYKYDQKNLIYFSHENFVKVFNEIKDPQEKREIQMVYYYHFIGRDGSAYHEKNKVADFVAFLEGELSYSGGRLDTYQGQNIADIQDPNTRVVLVTRARQEAQGNISVEDIRIAKSRLSDGLRRDEVHDRALLAFNVDTLLRSFTKNENSASDEYLKNEIIPLLFQSKIRDFVRGRCFATEAGKEFLAKNANLISWSRALIMKVLPSIPKNTETDEYRDFIYAVNKHFNEFSEQDLTMMNEKNPKVFSEIVEYLTLFLDQKEQLLKIVPYIPSQIRFSFWTDKRINEPFTSIEWRLIAEKNPEFFKNIIVAMQTLSELKKLTTLKQEDWFFIAQKNPEIIKNLFGEGLAESTCQDIVKGISTLPMEILRVLWIDIYISKNTNVSMLSLIEKEILRPEIKPFFLAYLEKNPEKKKELLKGCHEPEMALLLWNAMHEEIIHEHGDEYIGIMRMMRSGGLPVKVCAPFYEKMYDPKNPYDGIRRLENLKEKDPQLLRDFFLVAPYLPAELEKLLYDINVGSANPMLYIAGLINVMDRDWGWKFNYRMEFLNREIFSEKNMPLWPKYIEQANSMNLGTFINCLKKIPENILNMIWEGILKRASDSERMMIMKVFSDFIIKDTTHGRKFLIKKLFPEGEFYAAIKDWETIAKNDPSKALQVFLACGEEVPEKYRTACMEIFERFSGLNDDVRKLLARTSSPNYIGLSTDISGIEDIADNWVLQYVPHIADTPVEARKLVIRYIKLNNISGAITEKKVSEICQAILDERNAMKEVPLLRGRHVILIYPVEESISSATKKNIEAQQSGVGKLTILSGQRTSAETIRSIIEKSDLPLTIMYDGHAGQSLKLDNHNNFLTMENIAQGLMRNYKRKFPNIRPSRGQLPILAIGGCSSHETLRNDLYRIMKYNNSLDTFPTLLLETEYSQSGQSIKTDVSPMGSYFFENVIGSNPKETSTIGTYIEELNRRKKTGERITGEHPLFTRDPATSLRYELADAYDENTTAV